MNRVVLLLVCLLLATVGIAGSAQAAKIPVPSPGDPVCVPPGAGNGACVHAGMESTCAWTWMGPQFHMVCVDQSIVTICAQNSPVLPDGCSSPIALTTGPICVPPGAGNGACVAPSSDGVCAWTWFGPDNRVVCVGTDGSVMYCNNHGGPWGPGCFTTKPIL